VLADDEAGHQIVEDLGAEDLAARWQSSPAERALWVARAVDAAAAIAALPDPGVNPAFDAALFRRELDLAREAVFDFLGRRPLEPAERAAHDAWADALVGEILAHPTALCHRDFHGNNLFPSGDRVAVIDFQDLRRGPDAYDLASLLWERTTLAWMDAPGADAAVRRWSELRGGDPRALSERLERVLLQRAWKVCGTFARAVAAGKGEAYRRYLPGELALVRRLLRRSEDHPFREILASRESLLIY
jgi:aminoglycoside/choline kinase family phosphotransferase